METPRIDDAMGGQEVRLGNLPGKRCIYFSEMECQIPQLRFKICMKCPRAARYIRTNVVQSIFERIKALAISLMNKMNIQSSK